MLYKKFYDKQAGTDEHTSPLRISSLGLGNMRLPTEGEDKHIDVQKAQEIIEYAYENGVNYFDTAYGYHGGESERFVGRVLAQYPRGTWYLASKMPGHMMDFKDGKLGFKGYMSGLGSSASGRIQSCPGIFEEQLEKCGVDYFDFYLLHNLCETSYGFYTDKDLRVVEHLLGQKKAGRIRHLGFSAHGRAETIDKFLNVYDCFEFVQIQLNYMDWILQDAGRKYEVITRRRLPVIVMEPCRGGKLASLGREQDAMLKAARPEDSVVSWAFRYLQSLEGVSVVLSGMTTMEQLKENIAIFSKHDPVTDEEKTMLDRAVKSLMNLVPCTACRYCCDGCPQGLDIPKLISLYNEVSYEKPFTLNFTMDAMTEAEMPSACIACGACSAMCPQNIDIPGVMGRFAAALK
ncbi:MAG: aldo/keto reductase [Clostridiales bacterium]|nr:aldo/keto reductase [Clostridiales bacterium]